MKRFVCFKLMGLSEAGHFASWQPLGNFRTLELAERAAAGSAVNDYRQVRIVPYYRVDSAPEFTAPAALSRRALVKSGKQGSQLAPSVAS